MNVFVKYNGFRYFFPSDVYVVSFLFSVRILTDDCRYLEVERKKRELANKRIEHVDIGNRLWEEEMCRRRERSAEELRLEMLRREREKKLLTEFADLRKRTRTDNANRFREQLEKQCVSIL